MSVCSNLKIKQMKIEVSLCLLWFCYSSTSINSLPTCSKGPRTVLMKDCR